MIYVKIFWSLGLFFLSGCLGSALLVDNHEDHAYGNLATVPDRPAPHNPENPQKDIRSLKKERQKAIEENNQLRQQYDHLTPLPDNIAKKTSYSQKMT